MSRLKDCRFRAPQSFNLIFYSFVQYVSVNNYVAFDNTVHSSVGLFNMFVVKHLRFLTANPILIQ